MQSVRRRHAAGETTRALLMATGERLFAERGVEGVTVREIQEGAGQSNASVVAYHFGSKTGLVHALIEWRNAGLDERRAALLAEAQESGHDGDPRTVVWMLVRPLVESIRDGEMYVPFLARLSENPRANTEYWPSDLSDWTQESMQDLVGAVRFEQGGRYLVSASNGQVTVCGFSAPYSADLAGLYEQAFG